ncbi:hypothetical protein ACOMHN_020473 [Nucella lapillus]
MSSKSTYFRSTEVADAYVKYRPSYGPDLYETIVNFCREIPSAISPSLAVDVGCGSGQSTVPLTKFFPKVVGLDISQAQISKAPKGVPGLSFRVGPAEDLSFLESGSVDLVTVAAALHWMDRERFYAEVERVLKPGGALVAYCYNKPTVDEAQAQEVIEQFYSEVLQGFYPEEVVRYTNTRYTTLSLPFAGWRRNDDVVVQKEWSVDDLMGFLWSLTTYQMYLKHHPTSTALTDIKHRLCTVYQDKKGGERKVLVTWSIFMLMGHKPQS